MKLVIISLYFGCLIAGQTCAIESEVLCWVDLCAPSPDGSIFANDVSVQDPSLAFVAIKFKNLSDKHSLIVPKTDVFYFVRLTLLDLNTGLEVPRTEFGVEAYKRAGEAVKFRSKRSWEFVGKGCTHTIIVPLVNLFEMPRNGEFRVRYEFLGLSGDGQTLSGNGCSVCFVLAPPK